MSFFIFPLESPSTILHGKRFFHVQEGTIMNNYAHICAFILYRYVQAGTIMNNYAHIFELLTRLRQVNDNCTVKLKLLFFNLLKVYLLWSTIY
jgi:hypothetical protein